MYFMETEQYDFMETKQYTYMEIEQYTYMETENLHGHRAIPLHVNSILYYRLIIRAVIKVVPC